MGVSLDVFIPLYDHRDMHDVGRSHAHAPRPEDRHGEIPGGVPEYAGIRRIAKSKCWQVAGTVVRLVGRRGYAAHIFANKDIVHVGELRVARVPVGNRRVQDGVFPSGHGLQIVRRADFEEVGGFLKDKIIVVGRGAAIDLDAADERVGRRDVRKRAVQLNDGIFDQHGLGI